MSLWPGKILLFWPGRSLKSILTSSLIFLVVFPGIMSGLLTLNKIASNMENEILVSNLVMAKSLSVQIDEILSQAEKIVSVTGEAALNKVATGSDLDALLIGIAKAFPAFSRLNILDRQGIISHSSRKKDSWIGYDFSRHSSYLGALNKEGFCWSLSHIPVKGNTPGIAVSRMFDSLVVLGYLDLADLSQNVGILASEAEVRVTVLDRKGTVVASSEPGMAEQRLNLLNIPYIRQALKGEFASGRRYDEKGIESIVSVDEIVTADLVTVIFRDASKALAPVIFIRKILMISLFVSCLGTTLVFIYLYRSIKLPLTALSSYTDRVAQGHYDLQAGNWGLEDFNHLSHNFVLMTRAISARESALEYARKEAEAATNAKSVFLANMSHEIRTPLNAVTGFSELLSSLVKDEKQKQYISAIKNAGKNLLTLINDILDLSKMEAGKTELKYTCSDLRAVIYEIEQIFALQTSRKNIRFIVEVDADFPPALMIDEIRLRQILLNIVGNAVKFTENGTIKVTVTFMKLGDLHIIVEDSGIGIPEDEIMTIFDSFKQQAGQDNAQYGGTGLGLAICKRVVEMMNGRILVESSPGKGSCFEVIIPDVQALFDEVPLLEKSFYHEDIRFENGKVLVVDDIESNRHLLNEVLCKVNLDVLHAQNGHEALLIAGEHHPDVILMDIRMPVMNGFEALEKIKNNPVTQKIPVIAVTASSSVMDKPDIIKRGFDGFLAKPVEIDKLLAELSKYLPLTETDSGLNEEHKKAINSPSGDRIMISQILATLESDYMEQWRSFKKRQPIDKVKLFGENIRELGLKNDIELLTQYGDNLVNYVDNFDILNMRLAIAEFKKIIQEIKSMIQEMNP
ncbi:MAG: response regulator [Desulfamplus sp.]|nr:response regulator [Desulfamplus sp.]